MKYMGSKAKITKFIVPIIQQKIEESGSRTYLEPFAGGCNVIDKVNAKYRVASDKNEYSRCSRAVCSASTLEPEIIGSMRRKGA